MSAYNNIRALAPLDELLLFSKRTGLPITLGAGLLASGGAQASQGDIFWGLTGKGVGNFLRDAGDFILDFFVSPGTANAPTSYNPGNNYPGSAAGGFLLYPNKVNSNMAQSVYAK